MKKTISLLAFMLLLCTSAWADALCSGSVNSAEDNTSGLSATNCTLYWSGLSGGDNAINVGGVDYYKMGSSSAYVQIKLTSGNFQAGDVVTATVTSNGDKAKTVTLALKSDDGNKFEDGSVKKTETTTITRTLVAGDIEDDGSIKIFRGGNTNVRVRTFSVSGTSAAKHTVTTATSTGDNSLGSVSAASSTVAEGGTTVVTAVPVSGYKVTNWAVSGTGASISPNGASNSLTTTLTMGNADATVTVTFGAKSSYTVSNTLSNVTKTSGATSTYELTEYTAVFAAAVGYVLPSDIIVTAAGSDITENCTWDKATGTLTIPAASVTGNIVITITGEENTAPTSGTLFSFTIIENVTTASVAANSSLALNTTSHLSALEGGSVLLKNTNTSAYDMIKKQNSKGAICMGSDKHYFVITLNNPIQENDVITFTSTGSQYICFTKTESKSDAIKVSPNGTNKLIIGSGNALIGETTIYVWRGGGNTYVNSFAITRPSPVSVSSVGWSTFSDDNTALDFTGVTAVSAYMVTSVSGSVLELTEVTGTVPAGTGLLISGEANSSTTIPVAASSSTDVSDNLLKKGTGAAVAYDANSGYNYVMVADGGKAVFQRIVEGTPATVNKGKAYLALTAAPSAPSIIRIVDEENNATSIQAIDAKEEAVKFIENGKLYILRDGVVYDAMGRVVR